MIRQGLNNETIEKETQHICQEFKHEAEKYFEGIIHMAVRRKENIILESTGSSDLSLNYIKENILYARSNNYRVVVIFPYAPINVINSRDKDGKIIKTSLQSAHNYSCEHFYIIADICDEVVIKDSTTNNDTIYHRRNDIVLFENKAALKVLPVVLSK